MPKILLQRLTAYLALLSCMTLLAGTIAFMLSPVRASAYAPSQRLHPATTSPSFPYITGSQIYDGSGNALHLRGAMEESSLAYINQWEDSNGVPISANDPRNILNPTTFQIMHNGWGMNAIRINISQWIDQSINTQTGLSNHQFYMSEVTQIVDEANQAGLYVILDFHDDSQSGAVAPYDDARLHQTSVTWWTGLATTFMSNTMILFDIINEPKYGNWGVWNGSTPIPDVVGIPQAIAQIRSAGARQIIVAEPGDAAKGSDPQNSGWQGYSLSWITDSGVIYSKHEDGGIVSPQVPPNSQSTAYAAWDKEWGHLVDQNGTPQHPL